MNCKILVAAAVLFTAGCSNEVETIVYPSDENLEFKIFSSFEKNGEANFDGWLTPGPPLVKISPGAPEGGGKFSALIKSEKLGAFLKTAVEESNPGTHNYRLSAWGKTKDQFGIVSFYIKRNDSLIFRKSLEFTSSEWSYLFIDDTVTTLPGDSLVVILSGSENFSSQAISWFDLCKLEEIIN